MFNTLRITTAIAAGKAAGFISRALGRGGGTTLPGVVARQVAPDVLQTLAARLPAGVAIVAGTNGKTTTTRMIAAIRQATGQPTLHNRAGANLLSGLTSTAIGGATLDGRMQATLGLFETDEAALPEVLAETQPRLVVLLNLFRDQLDRYGEVDTIAKRWRVALEQLPATSTVLLNADDPAIANLGAGLVAQVRYFGIEDTRHGGGAAHMADSQFCQRCGTRYTYSTIFYGHIGHYLCPNCGKARPAPEFKLVRLDLAGTEASHLYLTYPSGAFEFVLPLPGLYNALNALAAVAASLVLAVSPAIARAALEQFNAAFGRIERINAGGKPLFMALIKNPVGASETVRMLTEEVATQAANEPNQHDDTRVAPVPWRAALHVLIAINDRHADGTDVSWLWDADFERLGGHVAHATVAGTRAEDMAVRLKYAGLAAEKITTEPDVTTALDAALAALPAGATLYTLPTYTAMLELRAELVKRGWARPFWED